MTEQVPVPGQRDAPPITTVHGATWVVDARGRIETTLIACSPACAAAEDQAAHVRDLLAEHLRALEFDATVEDPKGPPVLIRTQLQCTDCTHQVPLQRRRLGHLSMTVSLAQCDAQHRCTLAAFRETHVLRTIGEQYEWGDDRPRPYHGPIRVIHHDLLQRHLLEPGSDRR